VNFYGHLVSINFLIKGFSGTLVKKKPIDMEEPQHCPICQEKIAYSQRYPRYICKDCANKTTDLAGRPVVFYNTSLFGQGCRGQYKETKEFYPGDICFVNGIKCQAEEFRFGGIVVQVV
jgi:hypothetical protein